MKRSTLASILMTGAALLSAGNVGAGINLPNDFKRHAVTRQESKLGGVEKLAQSYGATCQEAVAAGRVWTANNNVLRDPARDIYKTDANCKTVAGKDGVPDVLKAGDILDLSLPNDFAPKDDPCCTGDCGKQTVPQTTPVQQATTQRTTTPQTTQPCDPCEETYGSLAAQPVSIDGCFDKWMNDGAAPSQLRGYGIRSGPKLAADGGVETRNYRISDGDSAYDVLLFDNFGNGGAYALIDGPSPNGEFDLQWTSTKRKDKLDEQFHRFLKDFSREKNIEPIAHDTLADFVIDQYRDHRRQAVRDAKNAWGDDCSPGDKCAPVVQQVVQTVQPAVVQAPDREVHGVHWQETITVTPIGGVPFQNSFGYLPQGFDMCGPQMMGGCYSPMFAPNGNVLSLTWINGDVYGGGRGGFHGGGRYSGYGPHWDHIRNGGHGRWRVPRRPTHNWGNGGGFGYNNGSIPLRRVVDDARPQNSFSPAPRHPAGRVIPGRAGRSAVQRVPGMTSFNIGAARRAHR